MATRNQNIYTVLRRAGLTHEAALGMMGNWDCESNLEPGRLQGDFSSMRVTSRNYVARLTSGALSKSTFMSDQKGYGLAQWTLAYRKGKLYDYWKSSGMAVDSEIMQARFAVRELQTEGEYSGLFQMLKTSVNMNACAEAICKNYERPAINNITDRCEAAERLAQSLSGYDYSGNELAGSTASDSTTVTIITPAIMPTHEYWPPRIICQGMKGPDVEVLCSLLKAQEYGVNYIDDAFGSFLTERVKAYQTDKGLKPDGIVGPLTWTALLKINSF